MIYSKKAICVVLACCCLSGTAIAQNISLTMRNVTVKQAMDAFKQKSGYSFVFSSEDVDTQRKISVEADNMDVKEVISQILDGQRVTYEIKGNNIVVRNIHQTLSTAQKKNITGTIVDPSGMPVIGANVMVKGTTNGTITDMDGKFSLEVPEGAILQISYIGFANQEIKIEDQKILSIRLQEDAEALDEVVVIGYGSVKKKDLTGAVIRADLEAFKESGNLSVLQSLQGSVPGLEISQTTGSGKEADMVIRGEASINGESKPLIVLDGVIYRGRIIDINPNDIESIDVLKDASSAAIYGSQAANGVIIITTKKGIGIEGKPLIHYSGYYSFQSPAKELKPGSPEDFILKNEYSDIFNSRTEESGYLERNPNWDVTNKMKTTNEIEAYHKSRSSNWYDLITNDQMYTHSHNLSVTNQTKFSDYLISVGYTGQQGYLKNDDFQRINARININNKINDWLMVGVQSFMSSSDYSGQDANAGARYNSPYAVAYDENNDYVLIPTGLGANPLIQMASDHLYKKLEFFGNIYAEINFPFLKGLKFRTNYGNTYNTTSLYYYRNYEQNFQGKGSKTETKLYDWSVDNILTYQKKIREVHNLNVMLGYGLERRSQNSTTAESSVFASGELGYNNLQAGSADMQKAITGAWEESSMYTMGRLMYGYNSRYLFTGTIRRDGFSGFSKKNKFGLFPSASIAWVLSEENFMKKYSWLDNLKLRLSYGSVGNRTIGRYQTLAVVDGGYNYITADGTPVYTQFVNSLESPDLKWETTTGVNLGLDFTVLSQRLWGTIDYYNNNTTDLLYNVDIPGMSGFESFPDNLGRINNYGLEISLNSVNIKKENFEWGSTLTFSRMRNKLEELLGFDNDGDGKEDDLVSEGLFIGESLSAIYDYTIDGLWQLGDDIPDGFDVGSYKVVDINKDGKIDINDKSVIGYRDPAYSLSFKNYFTYKNWTFRFFITTKQGGKDGFLAEDTILAFAIKNQENHFNMAFPKDLDYWRPDNIDAIYQRPGIKVSDGIQGTRYSQRNYIRLQDISLSYNFSKKHVKKIGLNQLLLYISGKNLLTFTKWRGWDPETGVGITPYGLPIVKSFTLGLSIGL